MKNEDAISSTMGVMLIVSVAVIGTAIVGVTMMSQQDVQEIPKIDVIPNVDDEEKVLYLCHGGGDPLPAGELQIIVDGEDKSDSFGLDGVGDTWGIDETIEMHYTGDAPKSVQIIHTGSGISTLLKTQAVAPPSEEAEMAAEVVDEGVTEPPEDPEEPGEIEDPPGDPPIPEQNLGNSVIFIRKGNQKITHSGSITFRVTETPSSASGGSFGNQYLHVGDTVTITGDGGQGESRYITLMGVGNRMEFLQANHAQDITILKGGNEYSGMSDIVAQFAGYEVLPDPTFTIKTWRTGNGNRPYTLLIVDGETLISENTNDEIKLIGIQPIPDGIFMADTSGRGNWDLTIFIGNVTAIQRDGSTIYST